MTKLISSLLALSTLLLTGCPGDAPRDRDNGQVGALDAGGDATMGAPNGSARPDAGGDGGAIDLGQANLAQLMRCGLYEPSLGPSAYSIEDAYDACIASCTLASSCAELKDVFCWEDELGENTLTRCLERCDPEPADGFRCADGTRIAHAFVCDFEPDCSGNEDEASCGQFRCADGEVLPNRQARCDYVEDCEDGSDERGCALTCAP